MKGKGAEGQKKRAPEVVLYFYWRASGSEALLYRETTTIHCKGGKGEGAPMFSEEKEKVRKKGELIFLMHSLEKSLPPPRGGEGNRFQNVRAEEDSLASRMEGEGAPPEVRKRGWLKKSRCSSRKKKTSQQTD